MLRLTRIFLVIVISILIRDLSYSQWQYYDSPEVGETIDLFADGNRVYVLATGGLFFTDNLDSLIEIPIPNGAFNPKKVFAGGDLIYLLVNKGHYATPILFRSDNMGQSWEDVTNLVNINSAFNMIFKGDTIMMPYLGWQSCMVSENGGNSFYEIAGHFSLDGFFVGSTVYSGGLTSSSDLGKTWTWHYSPPIGNYLPRITLLQDKIFLMLQSYLDSIYFISSPDLGQTWDTLGSPFYFNSDIPHFAVMDSTIIVYDSGTENDFIITNNLGTTWDTVENENGIYKLISTEQAIYGVNKNFLFTKVYNNEFTVLKKGFKAASISQITQLGSSIWVGANEKYFEKSSASANWENIVCEYLASTGSENLLMVKNEYPRYSHDGGEEYKIIPYQEFGPFYPEFRVVSAANSIMFLSDGYYNYYSSDLGVNWSHFFLTGGTDPQLKNMDFSGGKHLAAVYPFGSFGYIYESDNGHQWTKVFKGFELNYYNHTSTYPSLLHLHQDHLFVFVNSTLWHLPPGHGQWEKIPIPANNPDTEYIKAITLESFGELLIAGVHGYGVYISEDVGKTWNKADEGLENLKILSSTIINDTIYLGMEGGIWRRPLSEYGSTGSHTGSVTGLTIFPNPVSNELIIKSEVGLFEGDITIVITDLIGNPVVSKKENKLSRTINVQDLPAGFYLISINNGTYVQKFVKL